MRQVGRGYDPGARGGDGEAREFGESLCGEFAPEWSRRQAYPGITHAAVIEPRRSASGPCRDIRIDLLQ